MSLDTVRCPSCHRRAPVRDGKIQPHRPGGEMPTSPATLELLRQRGATADELEREARLCKASGKPATPTPEGPSSTERAHTIVAHLKQRIADAEASVPTGVVREVEIKSARESEWYVLHGILTVPGLRDNIDCAVIGERVDELHKAVRAAARGEG